MLDKRSTLVYFIAGTAVTASAWTTFVPGSVSGSTFGSILAVTIGLFAVSTIALRSSRSTRSVAHVLYDTEHQSKAGAQAGRATSNVTDAS
jgi:hypothetical protein